MKRKGITIWEQYLERFVLGAAALFFVVFAALQILSQPNAKTLQGQTVPPSELDGMLREKAEAIQARLAENATPAVAVPEHDPVWKEFDTALREPISPDFRFPVERIAPGGPGVQDSGGGEHAFVVPDIAAPYSPIVQQQFEALTPEPVANIPELTERFPEEPYDIFWNIPVAVFDLAAVRNQYSRGGDDDALPIPANWYNDEIEVFDVRVEREEFVDGQWANAITLNVPPGMTTIRPYLEQEDIDKGTRATIRAQMAEAGVREAIVHPPFYSTVGESATPPDPRDQIEVPEEVIGEEDPTATRIRSLERNRARTIRQRDVVIQRIIGLGGTPAPEGSEAEKPDEPEEPGGRKPPGRGGSAPGSGRAAPGGGGGGGQIGGGGRRGSGGEQQRREEDRQKDIDKLQERLRSFRRRIADYTRQLQALRPDIELETPDEEVNVPWWEQDEVLIWAHDIDITPGKTYRYRFTVELYNPFFGRSLDLLEDQHHLAEPITLASQTSDWTDPVEAIPPSRVYITRATPRSSTALGGRDRGAQATAEVYRFFDGRWWLDTSRVEIGQRVGGEKVIRSSGDATEPHSIDFGTRWFVLDIIQDIDATEQDSDRGYGATVLLQSLDNPGLTLLFDPRAVMNDQERRRLRNAVELAEEEAASVATAG